jgi:adenine-specific DNA-methyltransferase
MGFIKPYFNVEYTYTELRRGLNMSEQQLTLDLEILQSFDDKYPFPSTRYQGSKSKIVDWIWENIKDINFTSCLDAFGGTSSVSHMLKRKGKQVYYNDYLKFNSTIGKAIIENKDITLDDSDLNTLLNKHTFINYPTFIQNTFKDIFYLDEENEWLDMLITNIELLRDEYKQSIAWFALFQACIIKRPYNLFHRANLYVRTSDVKRSFGNKATWDTPFEKHFLNFVKEANAAVFDNFTDCKSFNYNIFDFPNSDIDLVYIDTPYITSKRVGTDYLDFYHFLEGMTDYKNWSKKIVPRYKHKTIIGKGENEWTKPNSIHNSFDNLFSKFPESKLVISYRADGIPTVEELIEILTKHKRNNVRIVRTDYKYALSNTRSEEILLIVD